MGPGPGPGLGQGPGWGGRRDSIQPGHVRPQPPRSCEDYWGEWKHCRGLRHAFHHYYTHGELPDCGRWREDYEACRAWERDRATAAQVPTPLCACPASAGRGCCDRNPATAGLGEGLVRRLAAEVGRIVLKPSEGSREYFQFSAVKALDFCYSDISFLIGKAAALQGKGAPGVCRNTPGCSPADTGGHQHSVNSSLRQPGQLLPGRVQQQWEFPSLLRSQRQKYKSDLVKNLHSGLLG